MCQIEICIDFSWDLAQIKDNDFEKKILGIASLMFLNSLELLTCLWFQIMVINLAVERKCHMAETVMCPEI